MFFEITRLKAYAIVPPSPAVINETIATTEEFLDGELAMCETWEEFCDQGTLNTKIVNNAKEFVKLKQQGAGETVIHAFLGDPWTKSKIREALATIKDDKAGRVDREAGYDS